MQEERLVWLEFQKKKWAYQAKQRGQGKSKRFRANNQVSRGVIRNPNLSTMDGFLRQAQQKLLSTPWQIIHVSLHQIEAKTKFLGTANVNNHYLCFVTIGVGVK